MPNPKAGSGPHYAAAQRESRMSSRGMVAARRARPFPVRRTECPPSEVAAIRLN